MVHFNISAKFVSAFALLLAVMAAMGLFAVAKIGEVNDLSTELRSHWMPSAQSLGDVHAYIAQYRIKQTEMVDAPSPRTEKLVRNAQAVIDGLLQDYGRNARTPEQKKSFAQLQSGWSAYTAQNEQLLQLARNDNAAATGLLNGEALDGFYGLEDTILQMVDQDGKAASSVSSRSAKIYVQARTFLIGAICAGLLVAVLLLIMLMFNIARPINRISEAVSRLVAGDHHVELPGLDRSDEVGNLARALDQFKALFAADHQRAEAEMARAQQTKATIDAIGGGLEALAQGNLTHRVEENGHGALAELHVNFNAAVGALSGVLAKIVDGCTTIKLGTHEIAAATSDLSQRSEQQATSLAETARTLADFTGTVKITADNTRQTSSRLGVARATADKVESIARQAVEAMRSIEVSSREMAEIVNVIDGIAFQTNLLALNAGVEAARAGDSGKGFAVVANEVRALAQRSADAAKDIKALITTSSEQVGGGVSLVESSGDALRQIVGEVSAVSGLVDEIAEAAEKQAVGIAEISSMVAAMDTFTQQNAAMVEETSAGTHNLSIETENLVDQLARFRVAGARTAKMVSTPATRATRMQSGAQPLQDPTGLAANEAQAVHTPVRQPRPARQAFHSNAALRTEEDNWTEF